MKQKNKNKKIYILLSHTGSVVSTMIRRFSGLEYSHISIGVDESLDSFYSFGRWLPSNPLLAGFVLENIKDGVYTRFKDATYAIYSLDVTQEQYEQVIINLKYFEKNKWAYRYNFIGLISAKAGYSFDRKKAFFCSQFAARLFETCGIYTFDKKPGLVHPMDFLEIDRLKLISKGYLKDFRRLQWNIKCERKSYRSSIKRRLLYLKKFIRI